MFGLNTSAGAIWSRLECAVSARDLLADQTVDGSPDAALEEEEIGGFLAELFELQLVEICSEEPLRADQKLDREELELCGRPEVLWREKIQKVSASCAFFPATNPLCNQVPFG